jgi:uncharacterized RDD family membrane protein YckC
MTSKPVQVKGYQGYYAGFASRLAAISIDVLVVAVSFVVLGWLVSVTATMMQFRTILGFSLRQFPQILAVIEMMFSPGGVAVWALAYTVTYYVFFWSLNGQTVGKALLGLRVVTTQGKRVPIWRALLRFAGYFLSVLTAFLGFAWVLVDNQRQALHDRLAGTWVVYVWEAQPDEIFLADEIRFVHRSPARPSDRPALPDEAGKDQG